MKRRFLIHSLNHSFVVVDITQLGMLFKPKARTGGAEKVPALRFVSWQEAEDYFRANEADTETIHQAQATLSKSGVAVMTIS